MLRYLVFNLSFLVRLGNAATGQTIDQQRGGDTK